MTDEIAPDRLQKLEALRSKGTDPYPARVDKPTPIAECLVDLDARAGTRVVVAGRLGQMRDFGKLRFAHLHDRSGSVQIGFERDALPDFWPDRKLIENGDHVVIRGRLGRTQKGEPTVWADQVTLASKSLRHPPEKWHGLQDVEIRYRMRYVDLFANPEVRQAFLLRAALVQEMRNYWNSLGYVEVETPILQPIFGGATARPFRTHHNALDMPLYLRIAPELYLKRLLVGGLERVYEIGRVFRNEGISTRHNPEFTMLECYEAWADYRDVMDRVEGLFAHLVRTVLKGNSKVTFRGNTYDLQPPFAKQRYLDLFAEKNDGLDFFAEEPVRARARQLGIEERGRPHFKVANDVFEATVEPTLQGPVFVYDYPAPICPLAKTSTADPRVAERFELFIGAMEMGNAFSELNDPQDQERRLLAQLAEKDDESPSELDTDYVTALEFGMPPAGGLGIGIDRLAMLLTGSPSIRDVVLFPLLRPQAPSGGGAGGQGDGDR
ncbi:MAG TPA: lysine--tRNA ligase [Planctomycetota bacterium]|nr:lysine--tRNA ligase [Planctomycetota bacterium]